MLFVIGVPIGASSSAPLGQIPNGSFEFPPISDLPLFASATAPSQWSIAAQPHDKVILERGGARDGSQSLLVEESPTDAPTVVTSSLFLVPPSVPLALVEDVQFPEGKANLTLILYDANQNVIGNVTQLSNVPTLPSDVSVPGTITSAQTWTTLSLSLYVPSTAQYARASLSFLVPSPESIRIDNVRLSGAPIANSIPNGNFTYSDGPRPALWVPTNCRQADVGSSASRAGPNDTLTLTDSAGAGTCAAVSSPAGAREGFAQAASTVVSSVTGQAFLKIDFVDSTGKVLVERVTSTSAPGRLSDSTCAPFNTVSVVFRLLTTAGGQAAFRSAWLVEGAPCNQLANPSFELGLANWTVGADCAPNMTTIVPSPVYDGQSALKMSVPAGAPSCELASDPIPIHPSNGYAWRVRLFGPGTVQIHSRFYDATSKLVATENGTISVSYGGWFCVATGEGGLRIPNGATVRFVIASDPGASTSVVWDDLQVAYSSSPPYC